MNIILFAVTLAISFIIVRIGAIAFELTGVEWSLAKFQALSCFTGTGFTTRESEIITSNLQRRKIASVLMVLGNAGLVTLIATFANSLSRPPDNDLIMPFINKSVPGWISQWLNLLIIIVLLYTLYKLLSMKSIRTKLTDILRKKLMRSANIRPMPFDELAMATGGYGLISINVTGKNNLPGKMIKETHLKDLDIIILAIDRDGKTLTNPNANDVIMLNDRLFCFGRIEDIKSKLIE